MKLSHALTLVSVGLAAGAFALAQGCSSSSSGGGGGGPSVGGPPAKPSGPQTMSSTEHNFALKTLLLGDIDFNNQPSPSAWKNIGYNIDGKVTTADSTDVCKRVAGAPKSIQTDGANGIDNSFGENILPIIQTTAGQDASARINKSITDGSFTVMIDVTGFDDTAAQTATGLKAFLLAGGTFNGTPTFTKSDDWPVRPELLTNPTDPRSSKVQFPDAYVVNGTFVNGTPGALTLSLSIGGQALDLTVNQATVTFDHKSAGDASHGIIAGVINTKQLIDELRSVAGRISTSLCSGQAFDSIATQIQQNSDILSDGSQDPSKECDGISIGLGFQAAEIGLPHTVAPATMPSPDPCTSSTDGGVPMDSGSPQDASGGG